VCVFGAWFRGCGCGSGARPRWETAGGGEGGGYRGAGWENRRQEVGAFGVMGAALRFGVRRGAGTSDSSLVWFVWAVCLVVVI
jgi:hypothetical protein